MDPGVKAQTLIDLGSIMLITGAYRDAIEMLEAGLALTTAEQSHLRLHGLSELASVYLWTGKGERSQAILADALTLAGNLGDVLNEQELLLNQGILHSQFGDLPSARYCLEGALDSALAFGNAHTAVIALITLGVVYMRVGDFAQSEAYLLRAKEVAASHNHAVGEVMVLNNQGEWSLQQQDFEAALVYTRRAQAKATSLGLVQGQAYVLDTMAQAYLGMGRHEEALGALKEALAIAERLADEQIKAFVTTTQGAILVAMGDVQEGERLIRHSVALSEGIDLQGVAKGKMMLGKMLIIRGEIDEGLELVSAAQRAYAQMGATYFADIAARILTESGRGGFAIPEAGSDACENRSDQHR